MLTDDEGGLFAVDPNTGVVTFAGGTLTAGFDLYARGRRPGSRSRHQHGFQLRPFSRRTTSSMSISTSTIQSRPEQIRATAFSNTFTEQGAAALIGDTDVRDHQHRQSGCDHATAATIVLTNAQLDDDVHRSPAARRSASPARSRPRPARSPCTLTGTASYALYETAIEQIQLSTTGDPAADAPEPRRPHPPGHGHRFDRHQPVRASTIHITRAERRAGAGCRRRCPHGELHRERARDRAVRHRRRHRSRPSVPHFSDRHLHGHDHGQRRPPATRITSSCSAGTDFAVATPPCCTTAPRSAASPASAPPSVP